MLSKYRAKVSWCFLMIVWSIKLQELSMFQGCERALSANPGSWKDAFPKAIPPSNKLTSMELTTHYQLPSNVSQAHALCLNLTLHEDVRLSGKASNAWPGRARASTYMTRT